MVKRTHIQMNDQTQSTHADSVACNMDQATEYGVRARSYHWTWYADETQDQSTQSTQVHERMAVMKSRFDQCDLKPNYCMGHEICPKTLRPHLQGFVAFKSQMMRDKFIERFAMYDVKKCWVACAQKCDLAGYRYCKKEADYITNMPDLKKKIYREPEPLTNLAPCEPWMHEVHDIVRAKPEPRKIYWYWERIGGRGKSDFSSWLYDTYDYVLKFNNSTLMNIATLAEPKYSVYVFDIPRDIAQRDVPWMAFEALKDGFIVDSKLKKRANIIRMGIPTVICFANFEPYCPPLSADRLIVREILTDGGSGTPRPPQPGRVASLREE